MKAVPEMFVTPVYSTRYLTALRLSLKNIIVIFAFCKDNTAIDQFKHVNRSQFTSLLYVNERAALTATDFNTTVSLDTINNVINYL